MRVINANIVYRILPLQKGKSVPFHIMKVYTGWAEVQLHSFLISVLDGVVNFTPRRIDPRGKKLPYLLNRILGGPQSRFGHFGEQKYSFSYRDTNPVSSNP